MKKTKIILGIIVTFSFFTALFLTSCQKEDDDFINENRSTSYSYTSENESPKSSEITRHDISYAKVGVSNDCKKVDVCMKKGKLKNVSTNAAFTQLENGGMLFNCDPDVGLDLTEVITILTPRIIANGGDYNSTADQKDEFIVWFYETYCPADGGGSGDEGDGGTFEGDAGSNL